MTEDLRQRRIELEVFLLAALIARPTLHAWAVASLTPRWFSHRALRSIATAACSLRDAGRTPHWRRVRTWQRAVSTELADQVTALGVVAKAKGFGSAADVQWWSGELRRLGAVTAATKGWGRHGWEAQAVEVRLPPLKPGETTAHHASGEVKAAIVRDLAPFVACMPAGPNREHFEARIAQRVGVSRDAVQAEVRRVRR